MVKVEMTMEEKATKYDRDRKMHQEYTRTWVLNNKERYAKIAKDYMDRNREAVNEKAKLYQREKYKKIKEQRIIDKQKLIDTQIVQVVTIL
jgi:hypothetical protein